MRYKKEGRMRPDLRNKGASRPREGGKRFEIQKSAPKGGSFHKM